VWGKVRLLQSLKERYGDVAVIPHARRAAQEAKDAQERPIDID